METDNDAPKTKETPKSGIVVFKGFETSDGSFFKSYKEAAEHEALAVLTDTLEANCDLSEDIWYVILGQKRYIYDALKIYFAEIDKVDK